MKAGKGNLHSFMKMVLIIGIGMVALGAIWGYSQSIIRSDADVSVVDSGAALIAVRTVPVVIIPGSSGECGSITNNTSKIVELTVSGGFGYNNTLLPGASTALIKYIDNGEQPGSRNYSGLVMAKWEGGKAEINLTVPVTVEETPLSLDSPPLVESSTLNESVLDELDQNLIEMNSLVENGDESPGGEDNDDV